MAIPQEGTYKLNVTRLIYYTRRLSPYNSQNLFIAGKGTGPYLNTTDKAIDVTFDGKNISFVTSSGTNYSFIPQAYAAGAGQPDVLFVLDPADISWWCLTLPGNSVIKPGTQFTFSTAASVKTALYDRGTWNIQGSSGVYWTGETTEKINFGSPECFLPGTMIEVEGGEKPVEAIRPGDKVVTLWGGYRQYLPVIWVGSQEVSVHPHLPRDMSGYPVVIRAHAIEDGLPRRDLRLTAEHCIALEGRLIPVRMLVNNRSIFYDMSTTQYTAYHIKTQRHAVLSVEGIGAESFLDHDQKKRFKNTSSLRPELLQKEEAPIKPVLPIGLHLKNMKSLWTRIARRNAGNDAAGMKPRPQSSVKSRRPSLKILSGNGTEYRLERIAPRFYRMVLRQVETSIVFVSSSFRFCDIDGPYHDDRRRLGVLVEKISLTAPGAGEVGFRLGGGWHPEAEAWPRWTNGRGEIFLDSVDDCGQIEMEIRLADA